MPNNPAQDGTESLSRRIHQAYSNLPEGERRVAGKLLESPGELAIWRASELAQRAGVSNATVSRFFQRLGYRNFEAAKREVRRLREAGSPVYLAQAGRAAPAPLAEVMREESARIEATLAQLDPQAMAGAARAIAAAPRVRTLGFRNSHFLAQYLTAQLAQVRPGVAPMLIPGQTRAEGIAALGPGDVAVVVGMRRRPAGFAQMVAAIAARGARVLLLADPTVRGVPADAAWTLTCVVETSQFADSYVGALALSRLLILEVVHALGDAGNAYLEEVEALRAGLRELE